MIKIESLKDEDKGREVHYTPLHVKLDDKIDYSQCEFGRITSWNHKFIFVNYGCASGRGQATDPKDLVFTV